jgi:hypothetical protein
MIYGENCFKFLPKIAALPEFELKRLPSSNRLAIFLSFYGAALWEMICLIFFQFSPELIG